MTIKKELEEDTLSFNLRTQTGALLDYGSFVIHSWEPYT